MFRIYFVSDYLKTLLTKHTFLLQNTQCYIYQCHILTIKPMKAPKGQRHSCQIQLEIQILAEGFIEQEQLMLVIDSCLHQTVSTAQCDTWSMAGIISADQISCPLCKTSSKCHSGKKIHLLLAPSTTGSTSCYPAAQNQMLKNGQTTKT